MMTDFDFAGFLDTDNQKNLVISLIKLFDSIILEKNEEKILHNISEVRKNSISKDFGGLLSALSEFDLKDISSKLSLLAVINLITPNLSVSDELIDQWEITHDNSKEIIRNKIDNFCTDYELRYIAQLSQWSENNSENAMIFQKIADLFHNIDNIEELRKKIQSHYPDDLTKLIDELDSKRTKGFVQSDIINILDKQNIDIPTVLNFINNSSGRNWATMQRYPDNILTGKYDYGFSYELHKKDVLTFLDSIETIKDNFLLKKIKDIYEDEKYNLGESMDHTEIVKLIK